MSDIVVDHSKSEVRELRAENEKLRATINSAHEWVIAASNNKNSILRKANMRNRILAKQIRALSLDGDASAPVVDDKKISLPVETCTKCGVTAAIFICTYHSCPRIPPATSAKEG